MKKIYVFASLILAQLLLPHLLLNAQTPAAGVYPRMAPVERYLMPDRAAEIALAKSSAPASIADHAEVLVLGRQGYSRAVAGTNDFVCLVERSWTAEEDNPGFWNPKLRGPLCLNPAAARTYLPITLAKTKAALAGKSKAGILAALAAAFDKKELPPLEPGAMSYMLSKQGYLGDDVGHWHPHLMFFVPLKSVDAWGAGLPGSPIISQPFPQDRLAILMVKVANWSDGTADAPAKP